MMRAAPAFGAVLGIGLTLSVAAGAEGRFDEVLRVCALQGIDAEKAAGALFVSGDYSVASPDDAGIAWARVAPRQYNTTSVEAMRAFRAEQMARIEEGWRPEGRPGTYFLTAANGDIVSIYPAGGLLRSSDDAAFACMIVTGDAAAVDREIIDAMTVQRDIAETLSRRLAGRLRGRGLLVSITRPHDEILSQLDTPAVEAPVYVTLQKPPG